MKSGIACMFPGQGSQYVGMGKTLIDEYPDIQRYFDEATTLLGKDFLDLCLNGPEDELNDTANTQPCIYILSYSVYKTIEAHGIRPQVVCGHSLGEYSALAAAGTFKFSDGLRIVAERGALMSSEARRRPGTMLAVLGADMRIVDDVVEDLSKEGIISVANYNCPGQIVISSETALADTAIDALSKAGAKKVVRLPVSGAFHSAMMLDAEERFNGFIESAIFLSPEFPVVPNTTATLTMNAVELRNALRTQMSSPVKWQQSIEHMISLGIKTFVEVGPGKVLSNILKRIDKQVEVVSTDSNETLTETIKRLGEV